MRRKYDLHAGSSDIASLHGKDCSYNPTAFPPSMEVKSDTAAVEAQQKDVAGRYAVQLTHIF
jgi:hypothetical protein